MFRCYDKNCPNDERGTAGDHKFRFFKKYTKGVQKSDL